MNSLPVTLVTQDASQDAVSDAVYLDILRSLVEVDKMSFQQLADATGHASKAWWNLRYHGKRPIDEAGKNALRLLSQEFPPQPPSVTSVTQKYIHPDAAMWLVGTLEDDGQVRRVVMVAGTENVQIHANGEVTAHPSAFEPLRAVTPDFSNVGAKRESCYRPRLPLTLKERIEVDGRTVEQLIEAALAKGTNE
jgi:hypothetical protein